MSIQQAFDSFMAEGIESAIDSSTAASWGGSQYFVELFEDGHYRVLWGGSLGNLYDSPGVILQVPDLTDDEWDEDPSLRYYDNAKDAIQEWFLDVCECLQEDAVDMVSVP